MTYQEALDYIHSVCWKGSRPGLERTIELADRLGNPQNTLKFIHVAGTNGKGSTSAMLAAILQRAGYKVGLYTSPFILRFNERMRINGEDISDEELAQITALVRPHADAMADIPTEFELITAIALVYFARNHCDYVVFEVGMGGRLDSTNIITAETVAASVITGIAMDHTAFLGDTPEKIAAEKAGIIKAEVPVVYGGNHPPVGETLPSPEALSCGRVIREKAAALNAPFVETDHTLLSNIRSDLFGADFDFGDSKQIHISLAGLYQPHNAANALTVVDVLRTRGLTLPEEAVRAGLASVTWPARFEVLSRSPLVIADGGHNPEGIDAAHCQRKGLFQGGKDPFAHRCHGRQGLYPYGQPHGRGGRAGLLCPPRQRPRLGSRRLCRGLPPGGHPRRGLRHRGRRRSRRYGGGRRGQSPALPRVSLHVRRGSGGGAGLGLRQRIIPPTKKAYEQSSYAFFLIDP